MIHTSTRQGGIVLVVVLVMLVLITLLAVTMVRTGTVNIRIAQNVQLQQEAVSAAQAVIEEVISSGSNFADHTKSLTTQRGSFKVNVENRVCMDSALRTGGTSAGGGSGIGFREVDGEEVVEDGVGVREQFWLVTATATNLGSGAEVTVRQGVRIGAGIGCE